MKNENRAVFDRASERYHLVLDLSPAACQPPVDALARSSLLQRVVAGIVRKIRQRSNRLALLELTDDQLKDIGVSRSGAYGDISRYRRSEAHGLERKCL
ncbi:DUF1127 domain-containing protein [Neorhizobium galegae]|uniref:DUF1127 domain-containing protein n=1 Tax=Neorhizobium galegae TaxID=399 RepID=UPI000621BEAF|nr:DUF1127 domain-containing protein [Neorhizobium galegae]CDZ28300.1 Hypothetical protein NGAL_HAMBI490_31580 [Neorhizobium galegae bv. officinalis]KAA9388078.1 DUF1127 domain-containing protein [Neorhizobium galegae]KAB1115461.1 DUF1127 domain-containing protein [Neorhizobium galegae]MCM2501175.1 DUF1127 domain-containing protein [Neorhizobium galegae]MCQ1766030.1 DUF1127 domain-containing protein [Neorhizobium galegae]